jgi:hypothetical protein
MSTISKQIIELQTLPAAQLTAQYESLFGRSPRVRNVAWLRRQVAWALQARELGGLSDRAKARLDELVARIDLPLVGTAPARPRAPAERGEPKDPLVGTTLVREWRGQQVRVEVRSDGYVWDGVVYRSLTAAVRAITNSNWNPKIFFGLVTRRAAK